MVLVTGQLRSATGQPLITPFSITLTDYGVKAGMLYLPAKINVIPDIGGGFAVDLWSNQESDTPVSYRVDTPQGSSFFISIPSGVLGPLDIGKVVVTKSDLKHDANILNRLAQLEARPVGGGEVVQVLTLGDGLAGGSFNGSSPVTATVDQSIARVNFPTLVNPKSNQPSAGDSSDRLATTAWSGNAANLTTGTIPSARLPSNLAAITAQRLATPRSIFGMPFDGSADLPLLGLGTGLASPSAGIINIDFGVIPSVNDPRFSNAREWVAPTVTQTEAQAGTSTDRRAWTALRVWDAIGAWWATVQGSLARLASPSFTGTPTAPSPTAKDFSAKLATTEWAGNATNLSQGLLSANLVPTLNQDTTGKAAAANKLVTARNILGVPFDGTTDLPLTVGNGLAVDTSVLGLDPTDVRLTNAREWTANTVTQSEAETGTSTSRTAWTPQRVRQAITAWWSSFESTIARLASPVFTGEPTAPSPGAGDISTRLATTEWSGNASNLTTGTIPAARVPVLNQSTTGNATTATRLATGRTFTLSGGATTAAVTFDGTANINLAVTALDGALVTGVIPNVAYTNNTQTFTGLKTFSIPPRIQGTAPGFWLDETDPTDTTVKGAYIVLDGKILQIQRRVTGFGALEATVFQIDLTTGNTTITGGTTLGSNVSVKCKTVTGTTAATASGFVDISHGVTVSTILDVRGLIEYSAGAFVRVGDTQSLYASIISFIAGTQIRVANVGGEQILSKPIKLMIWYT